MFSPLPQSEHVSLVLFFRNNSILLRINVIFADNVHIVKDLKQYKILGAAPILVHARVASKLKNVRSTSGFVQHWRVIRWSRGLCVTIELASISRILELLLCIGN